MFIDENDNDELIIKFDELDYKVKNDLSLKINFDEKYNRVNFIYPHISTSSYNI